jgi:hypothetical protein
MNPLQFKYTITWTQNQSPSQWNIYEISNKILNLRNAAYETEANLIEQELDKQGLGDAQQIIHNIKSKL